MSEEEPKPVLTHGMRCPQCGGPTDVRDSRVSTAQDSVRRRRGCLDCEYRFTTYELSQEQLTLNVSKTFTLRTHWYGGQFRTSVHVEDVKETKKEFDDVE